MYAVNLSAAVIESWTTEIRDWVPLSSECTVSERSYSLQICCGRVTVGSLKVHKHLSLIKSITVEESVEENVHKRVSIPLL